MIDNRQNQPVASPYRQVNINVDIDYEHLTDAIEGYELIMQEGVLRHMGEILTVPEYADQICQLAALMQEVRKALELPPEPEPEPMTEEADV